MPNPNTHYFHVKTILSDFPEDTLVMVMPVWTPGSYLIREYSKNVNTVTAEDGKGNPLEVQKIRKNKWQIVKGDAKKTVLKYRSYAFDLSVRTAYLDQIHGFFNGTNIFTFPEGYKSLGGKLKITPYKGFSKISTPLPLARDGVASDANSVLYVFDNFDQLADSPFILGNQKTFTFKAGGVLHHVALDGKGNYDIEKLKTDMAKIVEVESDIFGFNPNKEYWCLILNSDEASGGLEHKNSTTLEVNRWIYGPDSYKDFLSVFAHEYFHLWNVKRLRPKVLVDYDYSKENYTKLLWVMEGFTTYYSDVALLRAGIFTKEKFLHQFNSKLNWIEGLPGNKVQPVSHASFDAWIKAYRPNENSSNTTISYYSKGALLASVFDAMIIKKYKGKKCLDDFMKKLYKKYYKDENIGFTQEEFQEELSDYLGRDMADFFVKYIDGTQTIPYAKIFEPLGLKIERHDEVRVAMGMSLAMRGGKLKIRRVRSGSQAEQAGLAPGDEIIAFNGFRVDQSRLGDFMENLEVGDTFNLIIARKKELMSIDTQMGTFKKTRYTFSYEENKLGNYWLRKTVN